MPLSYLHLDARTRSFMLKELRRDRRRKKLSPSPRLSPEGKKRFPKLLEAAIERGDDASLAASLRGFLNPLEVKRSPFCVADVPRNAATVIAEGAFNRFYVRALCLRAIEDGIESLQVFRAKAVESPRPESERLIGKGVEPLALLADLREHEVGKLGVPRGWGSGVSVRYFRAPPARTLKKRRAVAKAAS